MGNLLLCQLLNILWLYRNIVVGHDGEDQADHQQKAGKHNEFGPLQEERKKRIWRHLKLKGSSKDEDWVAG